MGAQQKSPTISHTGMPCQPVEGTGRTFRYLLFFDKNLLFNKKKPAIMQESPGRFLMKEEEGDVE
jgi:hypothetical protein